MNLGFDVAISKDFFGSISQDYCQKLNLDKQRIHEGLNNYFDEKGMLDVRSVVQDWFPEIKADVFLSHSHHDCELAIQFANWLYDSFGLVSFVDSMVWGYANELLKRIDDNYCLLSSGNYSYEARNCTTSHVHMMLFVALMEVMKKCECIFFMNTPRSISILESRENKKYTNSAWLYAELKVAQMMLAQYDKSESVVENFSLKVKYEVSLDFLAKLTVADLEEWHSKYCSKLERGTQCVEKCPLEFLRQKFSR